MAVRLALIDLKRIRKRTKGNDVKRRKSGGGIFDQDPKRYSLLQGIMF